MSLCSTPTRCAAATIAVNSWANFTHAGTLGAASSSASSAMVAATVTRVRSLTYSSSPDSRPERTGRSLPTISAVMLPPWHRPTQHRTCDQPHDSSPGLLRSVVDDVLCVIVLGCRITGRVRTVERSFGSDPPRAAESR
jgi:hypothetical protein